MTLRERTLAIDPTGVLRAVLFDPDATVSWWTGHGLTVTYNERADYFLVYAGRPSFGGSPIFTGLIGEQVLAYLERHCGAKAVTA